MHLKLIYSNRESVYFIEIKLKGRQRYNNGSVNAISDVCKARRMYPRKYVSKKESK